MVTAGMTTTDRGGPAIDPAEPGSGMRFECNAVAASFADALDEGLTALLSGDLKRVRAVEAKYAGEPEVHEFLRSAEAIRRALASLLPRETRENYRMSMSGLPQFEQTARGGKARRWSAAIAAGSERGMGTDGAVAS